MSIFPKRARPGQAVTIHWNFNTAALTATHIYPFVRIGVRDPAGQLTLLFEDYLLALPNPEPTATEAVPAPVGSLRPGLPLLVLASYLSGPRPREMLVDLLQGMQTGRHYYFVYQVPAEAPLGRYTLLSEVHGEGRVRHSKTAEEDFFLVESVEVVDFQHTGNDTSVATVRNPGPEPVPAKVVEYFPGQQPNVRVARQELPPQALTRLPLTSDQAFLLYSEDRLTLPLTARRQAPTYLRSQQLLALDKFTAAEPTTYVLAPGEEAGYELTGPARTLWERADGLATQAELLAGLPDDSTLRELLAEGLLRELPPLPGS